MKNKLKLVSFSLLVVLFLSLSFGCTPTDTTGDDDEVVDIVDEEIWMELGFLNDKYIVNDQQFIVIETNEEDLELEVLGNDLFDDLETSEFYMVSYNDKKVVKSIEANEFIKDLITGSEDVDVEETTTISKEEKFNTEDLTLLDSFNVDVTGNGIEEIISMYTDAEKGPDGEIMWDDGQDWVILVEGEDGDYVLFNEYVQIGSIDFFVYTIDEDFYVSTLQSGTANLSLTEYKFNRDKEEFKSSVKFATEGNVNMIYTSN